MNPTDALPELSHTARTLLIPLTGRAMARGTASFRDRCAEAVLSRVERDDPRVFASLKADRSIVWGSIQRSLVFDHFTRAFLVRHPGAEVLNLGAGLCTRAQRLRAGGRWIHVDQDAVVSWRTALLPPDEDEECWSLSLEDAETLTTRVSTSGPTLVIAEGVLMFVSRPHAEQLLAALARRLAPGSEILFDYIHPRFARHPGLRPKSMKAVGAHYAWGEVDVTRLSSDPRLRWLSTERFTHALPLWLRAASRLARGIAGGPLFDVAHAVVASPEPWERLASEWASQA